MSRRSVKLSPGWWKATTRGIARSLGVHLVLWRWETDTYPAFHADGPQGVIDELMEITRSDLVVGVFWKRFGTPTADFESGTEHELSIAWSSWKNRGRPQVMVYFDQAPARPTSREDTDQWGKVLDFKKRFSKRLWWSYDGAQEFERVFREHIQRFLLNLGNKRLSSGRDSGIFDAPTFADAIPRIQLWDKIEAAFLKHPVVAMAGSRARARRI